MTTVSDGRSKNGSSVEQRLTQLGLTLPEVPPAVGNFDVGSIQHSTLYLSGQGPVLENGLLAQGKVGQNVSTTDATYHAQRCGLVLIAAMKQILGSLEHVVQIHRIFGMVNATPDFTEHPAVLNGCSDLLCDVFGPQGRHARSAVGVGSLPGNITVEIEAVVSITADWEMRT